MSIDYICNVTASIVTPSGEQYDVSAACPVSFGKLISKFNGNFVEKLPFHEAISDKVAVILRGWFVKGTKLQVSSFITSPDTPVTCEATTQSIVHDIIKSLLNQLLCNS